MNSHDQVEGVDDQDTPEDDLTLPQTFTYVVWLLFSASALLLATTFTGVYQPEAPQPFTFDGLTAVIWGIVTFLSGIVHSYSLRYMKSNRRVEAFYVRIFAFTLVVMSLVAVDHVALFAAAWLAMSMLMASLIGHVRSWSQAREAAKLARRYFLASTAALTTALAVTWWYTGSTSISGVLANLDALPRNAVFAASALLLLAAMLQSALYPFHTWLLSSMTAPTPASALMHAGFVNAGGILLTRFAPVISLEITVMSAVAVAGAFSALLGQMLMSVQADVKGKLGGSTVAQMGFMVLQCGLGFFSAAIAHLILHGLYKAYLFLSNGAAVHRGKPKEPRKTSGPLLLATSLVTAAAGGVVFAVLTGKTTLALNTRMLLIVVVVLTTLHAARDVLGRSNLYMSVRVATLPVLVMIALTAYAVLFNFISTMLNDLPGTYAPTELTPAHLAIALAFAVAYVAMEAGWHTRSRRLYVALTNQAQPNAATVLTDRGGYDDE